MVVDIDMLREVAPHLIETKEHIICDPNFNQYSIIEKTYFGSEVIDEKEFEISDVKTRRNLLASWLAQNTLKPSEQNDPKLNKVLVQNQKKVGFYGTQIGRSFNTLKNGYMDLLYKRAQNSVPSMAKAKNFTLLQL